ncbi:MAG: SDR family NAD(P)-dependent oxidoreductase [Deltaproteobacteria bacterium]|nr:SDR family NAD(P)-dependent oxidoreductase [Deltaproteobacteria bacterium]
MFKGKGPSGFGYGSTAESVTEGLDLSGQTILLTGSNSGIGKETLRVLTKRGAHVIAAARTVEKAQAACDDVGGETTAVACELSDPASVQACVERVVALGRPLDAIICNAGIMALPTLNQKLGYELQFFTNHIGHFILVTSLLDTLAENGRVVMVSSDAHNGAPKEGIQFDNLSGERGYGAWTSYGQSKLANLLFASHLAKRLEGTGKTTQVYLAVHPNVDGVAGKYFSDCNVGKSSSRGRDEEMAAKLWEVSEKIAAEVTA